MPCTYLYFYSNCKNVLFQPFLHLSTLSVLTKVSILDNVQQRRDAQDGAQRRGGRLATPPLAQLHAGHQGRAPATPLHPRLLGQRGLVRASPEQVVYANQFLFTQIYLNVCICRSISSMKIFFNLIGLYYTINKFAHRQLFKSHSIMVTAPYFNLRLTQQFYITCNLLFRHFVKT